MPWHPPLAEPGCLVLHAFYRGPGGPVSFYGPHGSIFILATPRISLPSPIIHPCITIDMLQMINCGGGFSCPSYHVFAYVFFDANYALRCITGLHGPNCAANTLYFLLLLLLLLVSIVHWTFFLSGFSVGYQIVYGHGCCCEATGAFSPLDG
jgi:hypothetical protein